MRMFPSSVFAAAAALAACATLPMPALADTHGADTHGADTHGADSQMDEAASGPAAIDPTLRAAIDHPRRDTDRARDRYRHPAETLAFFRIAPGMTVVDYIPGGGWYTRILAPWLAQGGGRYIALNPDVSMARPQQQAYFGNLAATFPAKAAEATGLPAAGIAAFNTDGLPDSLKGTVDRVLIFREMHNLHRFGMMYAELAALRGLLRDDGLLGIVQHRARPDAPASYTDGNNGYLRERDVIALVEAHGFELVGSSEINANSRDTADHDGGVWVLPPAYRKGDQDRARYEGIGESDRMTLLFRKRR